MENTFGAKMRKAAEEMAGKLSEAAHSAGERIGEMRELQRLNTQIRKLQDEKQRKKLAMADLLIRMFEQNTFAEALLKPEYERIKQIDIEIAKLEEDKKLVEAKVPEGETAAPATTAATAEPAAVQPASDEAELLPTEAAPAEPELASEATEVSGDEEPTI